MYFERVLLRLIVENSGSESTDVMIFVIYYKFMFCQCVSFSHPYGILPLYILVVIKLLLWCLMLKSEVFPVAIKFAVSSKIGT